jgi:hypothetical protein
LFLNKIIFRNFNRKQFNKYTQLNNDFGCFITWKKLRVKNIPKKNKNKEQRTKKQRKNKERNENKNYRFSFLVLIFKGTTLTIQTGSNCGPNFERFFIF